MPKRLKALKASEVSLVKAGAIKRPIFVLKNEQGLPMSEAAAKNPFALTPEQDAAADACIKSLAERVAKAAGDMPETEGEDDGLSERAQQALKAVYRILLPFKDEITDADLDALQDSIGMADGEAGDEIVDEDGNEVTNHEVVAQSADGPPTDKEDTMADKDDDDVEKGAAEGMDWSKISKPDGMSDDDHKAAMDMAKGAYKSKMKASKATKSADGARTETKDEPVEKSLDAIAKSYEESNKALIAKTASLESQIQKMNDERDVLAIESDVRAQFKHLAVDVAKTAKVLKSLRDTDKDAHDSYLESLRAANEQVKVSKSFGSGGLYGQIGQSVGGMGADGKYQAHVPTDAESQLEALVEQHVGKGDCRTKADAWGAVLKTAKGAELYTQMAVEQNRGR